MTTVFTTERTCIADDGAALHVFEREPVGPSAGTVLCLPSLFFGATMFESLAARLPADWRLVCPDHRGQCRSGSGQQAPTIDRLARDCETLIADSGVGAVHLVGSSMGGYVAMALARRRSDLLLTCTLSCCTAHAEREPERFAALENALRRDGAAAMADRLVETMFGSHTTQADRPLVAHWRNRFAALDPRIADAVHEVFARPAMLDALSALTMPLLLVSGELDRAKRPSDMQDIADRVAGSRHVVMARSGHTPPVEEPDLFARELDALWRAA
jgi:3-oxoadipate enol-lactonase